MDKEDYEIWLKRSRYPGDYYPISEHEYKRSINIAKIVLNWVKENIKKEKEN